MMEWLQSGLLTPGKVVLQDFNVKKEQDFWALAGKF